MKKYSTQIIVGIVVIAVIVVYVVSQRGNGVPVVANDQNPSGTTGTSTSTAPAATSTNPLYKDGSYTGNVANAIYGNLQVQAVISGGQLTDVKFLEVPSGNSNTDRINASATIALRSEAIAAQSAQVNIVSGATQSSQAFIQSLGNALAQAKA